MSLLDELLPLIQKCRRLIDTDPVKAYSKAIKLYDWAIQEPFTNDEIHNQRFLLIEEVRALRRDVGLEIQKRGLKLPTNSSSPSKVISFPPKKP